MLKMAELVQDDVLNAMHGSLNQVCVNRDPSLAAATSPAGVHFAERNLRRGNAVPGGHKSVLQPLEHFFPMLGTFRVFSVFRSSFFNRGCVRSRPVSREFSSFVQNADVFGVAENPVSFGSGPFIDQVERTEMIEHLVDRDVAQSCGTL
jgi:hypothetical protein